MSSANGECILGGFELVEALRCNDERMLWRARHIRTETPAAVKILTGTLGEDRIEALEREVRAQARLQHPGVVRLYDYGVIGESCADELSSRVASLDSSDLRPDHPYLAMEWANHGSLRDGLPLKSWPEIRDALRSVLRTLGYAHARDVVHRDLKPENILVFGGDATEADEQRLKLGDFGLAHAAGIGVDIDEEALGSVSGTPGYLPPEQARGNWRDFGPWTDLYSVGCLAYRLVCHRLPFSGQSAFGVILKHVDAERPEVTPEMPVPAGLEDWMHRAMAIDPMERFQSAAEALAALPNNDSSIEASVSVPEDWRAIDSPDASLEPARRQTQLEGLELFGLREVPLVGRRGERDRLWRHLRSVCEEGGIRVIRIEGDAGVGKSRLAQWLLTIADEIGAARRLRVISSKGRPGPHEGLKGMTRRALRCRQLGRSELVARLERYLPRLRRLGESTSGSGNAQTARDAVALADWLEPASDQKDRLESEPTFAGEKQRSHLLARLLRHLCADRPAVLWLDDVPWDAEALDVLETFEPNSRQTPDMLVLATGRSDEFADNPTVRHRLASLTETHGGERIELAPLDGAHQRRLIDSMLPLEDSLQERLISQTEGNPLFAVQLLKHWVDHGHVSSGDGGFRVADDDLEDLPSDLVELWSGRIERLGELAQLPDEETVQRALEVAATQGRSVETDLWRKACAFAGLEVDGHLVEQLVARGLGFETEVGWEFAHGLLVESLETSARDAGRWAEHHRHWAEVLEQEPPRGDGRLSARCAEHLLEAGELEASLEPLLVTARRRGLLGNMTERYAALTQRQQVLDELGVPSHDFRRVENEAYLSAHLVAEERNAEAKSLARQTYDLATEHDWPLLRARTLKTLSECAKDEGDYDEAVDHLDKAIEAAQEIDESRLIAALHADRSWLSLIRGDTDAAREQLQACRRYAERADADYWKVNATYQMGQVEMSMGNREEARRCFEDALSEARRYGLQRLEALCVNSLGDFAKEDGNFEEALDKFEQFAQISRAVQIGRLELLARLNMAQVRAVLGETTKAERLVDSVSAQLAEADIVDHEGLVDTLRLVVAVQDTDMDRAIALFSPYEQEWPENQRLDHDIPWMLEQAHQIARENWSMNETDAGDPSDERARRLVESIGRRSVELYRRLGDEAAAERVQRTLGV